jgi:hypothetical protein
VGCETPKRRAISAAERRPESTLSAISARCWSESLRRRPRSAPPRGLREPRARALADHRALELGEGAHHLHHHAARRGGGVDRLRERAEARARRLDPLHDVEEVLEAAAEAVELPDHDHVALAELAQHLLQRGPVPAPARRRLFEDAPAAGARQRRRLRGVGLLVALADPGVAQEIGLRRHGLPFQKRPSAEGPPPDGPTRRDGFHNPLS